MYSVLYVALTLYQVGPMSIQNFMAISKGGGCNFEIERQI